MVAPAARPRQLSAGSGLPAGIASPLPAARPGSFPLEPGPGAEAAGTPGESPGYPSSLTGTASAGSPANGPASAWARGLGIHVPRLLGAPGLSPGTIGQAPRTSADGICGESPTGEGAPSLSSSQEKPGSIRSDERPRRLDRPRESPGRCGGQLWQNLAPDLRPTPSSVKCPPRIGSREEHRWIADRSWTGEPRYRPLRRSLTWPRSRREEVASGGIPVRRARRHPGLWLRPGLNPACR